LHSEAVRYCNFSVGYQYGNDPLRDVAPPIRQECGMDFRTGLRILALAAGLFGCAGQQSHYPPDVVQDSGVSATGNSDVGGALAPPPNSRILTTTHP
jgi:hypothetical protein